MRTVRYLGIDTGGTFTDVVETDDAGRLRFEKAFSTPNAPEQGILDALSKIAGTVGIDIRRLLGETERLAHGTTVSTNALIQRRGARVGLITTRGFEDTLAIGRGPIGRVGGMAQSKAMDFLHTEPPPPLVPKARIRGVSERIVTSGEVLAPLDEDETRAAIEALIAAGAESLAVCLLWSFRNPVHEQRVREIVRSIAQALPVSLSCEIAPKMGEYERTVTTVVNAFIGPVTERYIGGLQRKLGDLGLTRPVQIPAIKVVSIGGGGGSIAWTDGYRLQVGPQSAGADPGPACYGRGGEDPTVTDALVVLGIIDPENFFGGRYILDRNKACAAVATRVAQPLGLDTLDAAAGIYEVVTARMGDLIRKMSVESGHDPREFCFLSYGGGGGAHCAGLAAQLGLQRVIVPYAAPVFSALGVALSDIAYRHVRSAPMPLDGGASMIEMVNKVFEEIEERAVADLRASGFDPAEATMRYMVEMRYTGQMNEVPLDWPSGRLDAGDVPALRAAFEAHYQQKYGAGIIRRENPLEIISFRAEAVKTTEKPVFARLFEEKPGAPVAPRSRRPVYIRRRGQTESAIYAYADLVAGTPIPGPAVIERESTTIWLPPGTSATLDVYGNLAIHLGI